MSALALLMLLACAHAQEPASAPAPPPERPPLNLKLEEPVRAAPRITFGPREGKPEQRPADTLPSLGGAPSPALDRPLKPDSPGSPFPKDTNPAL